VTTPEKTATAEQAELRKAAKAANGWISVFYATVALIALAGQAIAAHLWLHWPVVFALPAVAALELGGIALSVHADVRRRLGERAMVARILSASVALFAVLFNWIGHPDQLQGAFFAGMSALGYCVWLITSESRRRDQLRASGKLPPTAPVYGLWSWARHPMLTRRARALALAHPSLGLYESLDAARAAVRTERRQAALSGLLRRKLSEGRDKLAAEIAVTVYDLDAISARLAAGADYDALAAIIAAELTPSRVAEEPIRVESAVVAPAPVAAIQPQPVDVPRFPSMLEILEQVRPVQALPAGPDAPAEPSSAKPRRSTSAKTPPPAKTGRPSAIDDVARVLRRKPDATPAQIAAKLGRSEATVKRHMKALTADTEPAPETPAPINGTPLT
jgi:hypothetical protein